MKIYRLEDKNGRGPYTSRILTESKKYKLLYDNPRGEGAYEDFDSFGMRHVCGFETINQLTEWFGRSLAELIALGMKICYYKTPIEGVLRSKSGKQVAFIKEYAKGPFYDGS